MQSARRDKLREKMVNLTVFQVLCSHKPALCPPNLRDRLSPLTTQRNRVRTVLSIVSVTTRRGQMIL